MKLQKCNTISDFLWPCCGLVIFASSLLLYRNICMHIQVWHVCNDRIQLGKEYHLFCAKSPRYFKSVSYIVYYIIHSRNQLSCVFGCFLTNNMYQNIWHKLICSDMFGVGISIIWAKKSDYNCAHVAHWPMWLLHSFMPFGVLYPYGLDMYLWCKPIF